MRKIEPTSRFKKDVKREKKGQHAKDVEQRLKEVVDLLCEDKPLPAAKSDHPLKNQGGDRECHVKPDLLLIYRKPDDETLQLIRLGSHSDLFG
jgi:mRNA interferase YafQ